MVVSDGGFAGGSAKLDASERVAEPRSAGIADVKRAVVIVELGFAADTDGVHAAEAVLDEEWSVGRHGNLIIDGIGSVLAAEPVAICLRVVGAHLDAVRRLLAIDLHFVGETLRLLAGGGLRPDGCGDFQVAAGFAVDANLAEFVFDAERLPSAQGERLLEVARDLLLARICSACGRYGDGKQSGSADQDTAFARPMGPRRLPRLGNGAGHRFSSKISSNVRCFS